MYEFETIQEEIVSRFDKLRDEMTNTRQELLGRLENHKRDQILIELKKLNGRLNDIEERLPPLEGEE